MKRRIKLVVAALTLVFAFTGLTGCMYIDGKDGQWHSWGPNCNDTNFTGMDCNEYGWWYFRNGVIDWNYTGMACNEYGWWYFENGQINWNYTGMACNEYGWWYYQNGRLDWNYTGWGYNTYGAWLYCNGNVAFWYTGEYGGYNVVGGHREGVAHVHTWKTVPDTYKTVHHDAEYCDWDEPFYVPVWSLYCEACNETIYTLPADYETRECKDKVFYDYEGEQYYLTNTKYTADEIVAMLDAKKKHMEEHPECKYEEKVISTEGRYTYFIPGGFRFDWISKESALFRNEHHHDLMIEAYDESVLESCGYTYCTGCGERLW